MALKDYIFSMVALNPFWQPRENLVLNHPIRRLTSLFLTCSVFATLSLAIQPQRAQAVQIGECTIHSASRFLRTTSNPNANRILINNIDDPEIEVDSHVVVSISEFSSEGAPFFGEAVFWVNDIAPYDGGFRLRAEVNTRLTNSVLLYKIFYTSFTGEC